MQGFFAQQVQKERVKDLRAPTCLALKEGAQVRRLSEALVYLLRYAQVMLLANVDLLGGLANGSRGAFASLLRSTRYAVC